MDFQEVQDSSTVTIKLGGDFNDPWLVVRGNPTVMRQQILKAFGKDDDPNLSLVELIATSAVEAHAIYALAKTGAKPEAPRKVTPARKAAPAKAKTAPSVDTDAAAQGGPTPDAEPASGVQGEVEAAESLVDLKRVWAENQDAFKTDTNLQEAFKKRLAELKNN